MDPKAERMIPFDSHLSRSIREGILDEEFLELLRLEGGSTLDLISEIVPIFFQEAVKVLAELRGFLDQDVVDFKKLEVQVYKLKSSSASIGAPKLKNKCSVFLDCCKRGIRSESVESLLQIQTEVYMVRDCLETLIKLEMEICEDTGSGPVSIANMGISGGSGGNGGQSSTV